jgi:hypothetical protein
MWTRMLMPPPHSPPAVAASCVGNNPVAVLGWRAVPISLLGPLVLLSVQRAHQRLKSEYNYLKAEKS